MDIGGYRLVGVEQQRQRKGAESKDQSKHNGDAIKILLNHCGSSRRGAQTSTEHVAEATTAAAMQKHHDDERKCGKNVDDEKNDCQDHPETLPDPASASSSPPE